jgi:hypothetical protein
MIGSYKENFNGRVKESQVETPYVLDQFTEAKTLISSPIDNSRILKISYRYGKQGHLGRIFVFLPNFNLISKGYPMLLVDKAF